MTGGRAWFDQRMKRTMLALAVPAALLLAACGDSSESVAAEPTTSTPAATTTTASVPIAQVPAANIYEVTEAGVTTAVNVPVDKGSPEFVEACRSAHEFSASAAMFGATTVEKQLALLQVDASEVEDATATGTPWKDTAPDKQALLVAAIDRKSVV